MAASHDAADAPRIAPLGTLGDFGVADGYPDPRGWDVVTADGTQVGTVHELIVDTAAMRTRYLDVALRGDLRPGSTTNEGDVLIPVGAARLDDRDDHVVLDRLAPTQLAAIPGYTHGPITRDYENAVLAAFPTAGGAADAARPAAGTDFYAHDHFDDRRFFTRGTTPAAADAMAGNAVATPTVRRTAGTDVADRSTTPPGTTGRDVGEGVGGASGAALGAAIGSPGGPIGMLIGGIAGALGGWWVGREVSDAATNYSPADDAYYRAQYDSTRPNRDRWRSFDDARPAYQLGHVAGQNPAYRGRSWTEVEPELQRGWSSSDAATQWGPWMDVRDAVRAGYERRATVS